ncbi:hypothetical protein M1P97_00225 [Parabacteroides sp. GYB001]|uniref:hypothetical protein n=1 Tax=Parabacteroides leei TaxID=2939491 RepID=UPI002016AE96|nr:hypothetical protein [Parabacteroides leei]MCL3849715.1 hypothetical protein [Parabacteroides leei]
MNRIDTILEKERTNTDRIFLYLCQDRLMAFGYSAYYATLLFPELEVVQGDNTAGVKFVFTNFPPTYLFSLSERLTALIGDEYIEVAVPQEIKSHRDRFGDWMDKIQK